MIAHSSDHPKVLHFKVDRIEDATAGPFLFEPPADFDLQDHLAGSFGVFQGDGDLTVRVRFLPRVAPYVLESKWHDSQQLSKQKDGSVLAEFHLSSTEEIKRWIMSFGQYAVVLEPELLRRELQQELQAMHLLYAEPSTPAAKNARPSLNRAQS